jgi:KipI family sensor histidine kinase inhibitor
VRFLPAADRGLVVEFGDEVSVAINNRVRALALALEAAPAPGIQEVVPTYRSLGIAFDPAQITHTEVRATVEEVLAGLDLRALPPPRVIELRTVYGGAYGPDLPFVAEHAGLSEAEVIRLHSQASYHVYMIGFAAGFAYLGGLPERIHTPRLPTPRIRTPRGSVGIGGSQTGAYPADTPGGWRLIGRTPVQLFDPLQDPPTPMLPGDTVRFVPIGEEEYRRVEWRAASGEPGREGREARAGIREGLEVIRPGLLTTVQDRGRIGAQKFGVPVSGAMDEVALRVGNVLVANPDGTAGLEITMAGPAIRFLADAVLALTGAEVDADLDGEPVPWYESFHVRAGQVLEIRSCTRGFRAYLTVAGGIDVPIALGSRSTCLVAGFGGFEGRALRAGDRLPVGRPAPGRHLAGRLAPPEWRPDWSQPATIRVVPGPQAEAFTEGGRRTFLESTYEVTPQVDRMGCRLAGPRVEHGGAADILSDWIPPGGVQVPGNGQPIILLADRQTTGGYTKIATVIGPDIRRVAQQRPGNVLAFRAVPVEEAERIARELERALAALPSRLIDTGVWAALSTAGEVPGEIPDRGLWVRRPLRRRGDSNDTPKRKGRRRRGNHHA